MGDWVQCSECGNRYDLDAQAFCSRCGSTTRIASVGPAAVAGTAPRSAALTAARRRAQIGGLLSTILGLLFVVASLGFLFTTLPTPGPNPDAALDNYLESIFLVQPNATFKGGALSLHVVNTTALPANVTLLTPGGKPFLNATTDAKGWLNTTLVEHAAATLRVSIGNRTFARDVLSFPESKLVVILDGNHDATTDSHRLGIEPVRNYARAFLGIIAGAGVLLMAAGICAILLRWHTFALIAPSPTLVLIGYVTVATAGIGLILLFLLEFVALVLVASGKRAFRRKGQ